MRLTFLTQNLSLKLFSLLASVLLYLFVSVESSTPVDIEVKIQYLTDDDIMITNDAPAQLDVRLRGPWAKFRSFMLTDLPPVTINLTGREPGPTRHRIDTAEIPAPPGMQVLAISPSELQIHLDRRIEKLIPIEVDPSGRPAFGFEIIQMLVEPSRVLVVGPQSKMRVVDFVYTRPVELQDRDESLRLEVDLRPPAPPIRLVERKSVEVFVDIQEESLQQVFEVAVVLENATSRARIDPSVVRVRVKGPRRVVSAIQKETLKAIVDANPEASEGVTSFEKSIKIPNLPDRVQVVGAMPRVSVNLGRTRRRRR